MHSRQHESELALARLGCAHLTDHNAPSILIGGLGMGYTLSQTLGMVGPGARVTVGELMGAVIRWNREFFGDLNGRPLEDKRVVVKTGDIVELISRTASRFDAILLDVDNGPDAMTDSGNRRLYGREGIGACRRALSKQGCLAVWSAGPSKKFEQRLMAGGFHVRRFRVPAYGGSQSQSRFCMGCGQKTRQSCPPAAERPGRLKKACRQKDAGGRGRDDNRSAEKRPNRPLSRRGYAVTG